MKKLAMFSILVSHLNPSVTTSKDQAAQKGTSLQEIQFVLALLTIGYISSYRSTMQKA